MAFVSGNSYVGGDRSGEYYRSEGPVGFGFKKIRKGKEFINIPGMSICLTVNSGSGFRTKGNGKHHKADFIVNTVSHSARVMVPCDKAFVEYTKTGKKTIIFNWGMCTYYLQQYEGPYRTPAVTRNGNKGNIKPDYILYAQKRKRR